MSKKQGKTQNVDEVEAKRRHDLMDKAVLNFKGQIDELETALGMYMVGRHFGWKTLYIIHSKKTVAKYESILGINIREEFPEVGIDADRSNGWRLAKAFTNFWKVVSGEEKLPLDREGRRTLE